MWSWRSYFSTFAQMAHMVCLGGLVFHNDSLTTCYLFLLAPIAYCIVDILFISLKNNKNKCWKGLKSDVMLGKCWRLKLVHEKKSLRLSGDHAGAFIPFSLSRFLCYYFSSGWFACVFCWINLENYRVWPWFYSVMYITCILHHSPRRSATFLQEKPSTYMITEISHRLTAEHPAPAQVASARSECSCAWLEWESR